MLQHLSNLLFDYLSTGDQILSVLSSPVADTPVTVTLAPTIKLLRFRTSPSA